VAGAEVDSARAAAEIVVMVIVSTMHGDLPNS